MPKCRKFGFLFVVIAFFMPWVSVYTLADDNLIIFNKPRSKSTYMIGLMKMALSYSATDYKYTTNAETLPRSAQRVAVLNGDLSIMWGGTSEQMESDFLPVRIDGYRGMMSMRIMIIRKGDQWRFDQVKNASDLRNLKYGQGRTWQDGKILEHSGLEVVKASKKASLFYMLDGSRFDAFPRGATEAWKEVAKYSNLDLTVEKGLVISYPLPTYFFVNRSRSKLASDIESGLEAMLLDGAFDKYFYSNDRVQQFLSKADLGNRRVIELSNPFLPKATPLDRDELWLTLDELKEGADAFRQSGDGL